MAKKENNNPITKKDLVEVLGIFTEDVLLPAMENMMDEKMDKRFAEHTHGMKAYIDDKSAQQKGDIIEYIKGAHTKEMKAYIDDKSAQQKGDIIEYIKGAHTKEMKAYIEEQKDDLVSYIKGDKERDKSWKLKVLDILKKNKLASPKELELLADFVK